MQGFHLVEWLTPKFLVDRFVVVKMGLDSAEFELLLWLSAGGSSCPVNELSLDHHFSHWKKTLCQEDFRTLNNLTKIASPCSQISSTWLLVQKSWWQVLGAKITKKSMAEPRDMGWKQHRCHLQQQSMIGVPDVKCHSADQSPNTDSLQNIFIFVSAYKLHQIALSGICAWYPNTDTGKKINSFECHPCSADHTTKILCKTSPFHTCTETTPNCSPESAHEIQIQIPTKDQLFRSCKNWKEIP